ncbi:MAG: outer membrane beta-barrel protein [Legionellales bacterium]|nr:outer membrane beta-barrel protein [Legionellales bacterium]
MIKKTLVAALLSCGVGVAFAGGMGYQNSPWFVDGAFAFTPANQVPSVVAATAGLGTASTTNTLKGAGAAFGVGYEANLTRAVVAGVHGRYGWYGNVDYVNNTNADHLKTTFSGFDGSAFVGYRLTNNTTAYVHGGFGYIRIKSEATNTNVSTNRTTWENVPVFGASLAYRFSNNVSALFDYSHFAGDDLTNAGVNQLATNIPALDSFQVGIKVNV